MSLLSALSNWWPQYEYRLHLGKKHFATLTRFLLQSWNSSQTVCIYVTTMRQKIMYCFLYFNQSLILYKLQVSHEDYSERHTLVSKRNTFIGWEKMEEGGERHCWAWVIFCRWGKKLTKHSSLTSSQVLSPLFCLFGMITTDVIVQWTEQKVKMEKLLINWFPPKVTGQNDFIHFS